MLTGKCKEDFFKEYGSREMEVDELYELILIIEFLDSKKYCGEKFFSYVFDFFRKQKLNTMTHLDVCKQTIESCNNYYNDNFVNIKIPIT